MNLDYTIVAMATVDCLQNVLPKLINSAQSRLLRFIGENIRLTDGLINHTAAYNITGLSIFLDFESI